jgi:hypothetical protein
MYPRSTVSELDILLTISWSRVAAPSPESLEQGLFCGTPVVPGDVNRPYMAKAFRGQIIDFSIIITNFY